MSEADERAMAEGMEQLFGGRIDELEAENARLQGEIAILESRLSTEIETRQRLTDLTDPAGRARGKGLRMSLTERMNWWMSGFVYGAIAGGLVFAVPAFLIARGCS